MRKNVWKTMSVFSAQELKEMVINKETFYEKHTGENNLVKDYYFIKLSDFLESLMFVSLNEQKVLFNPIRFKTKIPVWGNINNKEQIQNQKEIIVWTAEEIKEILSKKIGGTFEPFIKSKYFTDNERVLFISLPNLTMIKYDEDMPMPNFVNKEGEGLKMDEIFPFIGQIMDMFKKKEEFFKLK